MAINSYAELQAHMNQQLTPDQLARTKGNSPHGAMWELAYIEFVEGNVPGISHPTTGDPMPILSVGNGEGSNFVLALRGIAPFPFQRMPPGGPPFSEDQIRPIVDWINAGCPE
jgi:hypothetical protein